LEAVQRPRDDLDALLVVGWVDLAVVQPGGQEEVDLLVHHADAREERRQVLPLVGALADLLGQLALPGLQRLLPLLVELARRDLQHVGVAGRLARLAHEPDVLVVDRDDAHRAGVSDDLAARLLPVREAELALVDAEDPALVDLLAGDLLEVALTHRGGIMPARAIPAAAAARKNSGSSRPIVRVCHG
jgi:hypothetical protein